MKYKLNRKDIADKLSKVAQAASIMNSDNPLEATSQFIQTLQKDDEEKDPSKLNYNVVKQQQASVQQPQPTNAQIQSNVNGAIQRAGNYSLWSKDEKR